VASATIGALRVTLGLDSAAFTKGIGAAQKELARAGKSYQKLGGQIAGVGKTMSLAITAPFAALVASAIPAATESAQALAQVEAAQKSMNGVSGLTTARLQDLAGELQHISNFDDDDILKSVTANLLTFGNVSGATFERAQLAAVNLSARLGQDLQSSAIQLGKALNEPVKGVTALQRVGVSFTAQQKEQIAAMVAAGNTAGAQALILGELEKQFAGAAKAQRDATPTADLQEKWRTFQETLGAVALQVLPPLTAALTSMLEAFNQLSPGMQTAVIGVAAFAAVLGPIITVVGGLVTAFGAILPLLSSLGPVFATLGTIAGAVGTAFVALMPLLLPLLPWAAAAAGAVALVYAAWKNWDKITGFVAGIYNGVKTYLMDKLGAVFNWLKQKLIDTGKFFYDLYDKVVGHSYVPDMVDGVAEHFARLDGVMVKVAEIATGKTAKSFEGLRDSVQGILDGLFPEQAQLRALEAKYAKLNEGLAAKLITPELYAAARARLRKEIEALQAEVDARKTGDGSTDPKIDVDAIRTNSKEASDAFKDGFANPAKKSTADVVRSFTDMARDVIGSLQGIVGSIKNGDWLDALAGVVDLVANVLGTINSSGFSFGSGSTGGGSGDGGGSSGHSSGNKSKSEGFATGGSFKVGGKTGIDRNLIQFRATRGEIVDIKRPGARDTGSGGNTYHIQGNLLTPEFWDKINAGDKAAAQQGATGAVTAIGRQQMRHVA